MSEDVARLQEGIDAARKTFDAEREGLEDMLTRDFVSGVDAADTLLSLIDEYGLEHAGELLRERPGDFGQLRLGGALEIIEKASRANQSLDRLDELTHRREALLQREGGRVLNIQGQEFALRGEMPEAVPLEKAQPERELSMTELLRREKGIAPAEPSPAPTREQTHNR